MHYYRLAHWTKSDDVEAANDWMTGALTPEVPLVPIAPGLPIMKMPTWWKPPQTNQMIQQIQSSKARG